MIDERIGSSLKPGKSVRKRADRRPRSPCRGTSESAAAASPAFEPVMEMHAVPRQDVAAILTAAGVRLLRVRAEAHCGPRWEAFRYDVTADAAR